MRIIDEVWLEFAGYYGTIAGILEDWIIRRQLATVVLTLLVHGQLAEQWLGDGCCRFACEKSTGLQYDPMDESQRDFRQ